MKKTVSLIIIFFCALAFVTCDKKITRAIPLVSPCDFGAATAIVKTNATSPNLNVRKVLIEDYTGQFCGNCPKAARKAEALEAQYGAKVVVMANHVTDVYAKPQPAPDTLYQTDYRNDASNAWDHTLLISTTPGLPGGAINRTQPWAVPITDWQTRIDAIVNTPQSAKLVVTSYYDSIHFLLKVKVQTTFLQAFSETNISVVVAVTEDSIIGHQKDYVIPFPAGTISLGDARLNYIFNNMVLGSANGPLGQLVKTSPIVNDTATIMTPCFLVSKCFYPGQPTYNCKKAIDDKHVNVVAFLFNTTTQEVLQVEKLKIR
jgi:hypothetical protein